jgi:hypothetical protein
MLQPVSTPPYEALLAGWLVKWRWLTGKVQAGLAARGESAPDASFAPVSPLESESDFGQKDFCHGLLGQMAQALESYEAVRMYFERVQDAYDYALASLEEASNRLDLGQYTQFRRWSSVIWPGCLATPAFTAKHWQP